MPVLRSSKSKRLYGPLGSTPQKLAPQPSQTSTDIQKQFEKLISSISKQDIKACLQSSSSEAQFFGEICEAELNKLLRRRDELDRRIRHQDEFCKQKESEAARIVTKLWQETNKRVGLMKKNKISKLTKMKNVTPDEVKRVFEEAKKISNYLRMKKRKLVEEKLKLDRRIQLANDTIKFCNKFKASRK